MARGGHVWRGALPEKLCPVVTVQRSLGAWFE